MTASLTLLPLLCYTAYIAIAIFVKQSNIICYIVRALQNYNAIVERWVLTISFLQDPAIAAGKEIV